MGVDVSPGAVEIYRLRGVRDARVMSIAQVSSRLGRFDTILMMGGNFGLLRDFATARRLLGRFHRITSQRARIVAARRYPYDTDDPGHLVYHERNRRRGRMAG